VDLTIPFPVDHQVHPEMAQFQCKSAGGSGTEEGAEVLPLPKTRPELMTGYPQEMQKKTGKQRAVEAVPVARA